MRWSWGKTFFLNDSSSSREWHRVSGNLQHGKAGIIVFYVKVRLKCEIHMKSVFRLINIKKIVLQQLKPVYMHISNSDTKDKMGGLIMSYSLRTL